MAYASNSPHNTATIRAARVDELSRVQTIERAASQLFPVGRLPTSDQPIAHKILKQAIHDALLWVLALDNDMAVGFALAGCHDHRLHLEEVDVHPDYLRRGFGSALVEHVVKVAHERDYEAVTLTTFDDLPFNAPFYASLGFTPITEDTSHSLIDAILVKEQLLGLTRRIAMIRYISI